MKYRFPPVKAVTGNPLRLEAGNLLWKLNKQYFCTITCANPLQPTDSNNEMFGAKLQDVFIANYSGASHPPAAFCLISLPLLFLIIAVH